MVHRLPGKKLPVRLCSVVASCEKRPKLLQYAIPDIYPEVVCLGILPAITPEAIPLREYFPIEHDINVIKEKEDIITPHSPCMPDIIKELKYDTKKRNLTTGEFLEFAKNYVLNYKVSKDQLEEISLITVGQSSN